MVSQVDSLDSLGMSSTTLTIHEDDPLDFHQVATPGNGDVKSTENDRTSNQSESSPNNGVPDMFVATGNSAYRETSLTRPLLGSSSAESDTDSGVEVSPQTESDTDVKPYVQEASWHIALQIFFPYIIAGFGMVAAGMVLDIVQVSAISFYLFTFFTLFCGLLS